MSAITNTHFTIYTPLASAASTASKPKQKQISNAAAAALMSLEKNFKSSDTALSKLQTKTVTSTATAAAVSDPALENEEDPAICNAIAILMTFNPQLHIHDFGVFSAPTLCHLAKLALIMFPAKTNFELARKAYSAHFLNGHGLASDDLEDISIDYAKYLQDCKVPYAKQQQLTKMFCLIVKFEREHTLNQNLPQTPLWKVPLSNEILFLLQNLFLDYCIFFKPLVEEAVATLDQSAKKYDADIASISSLKQKLKEEPKSAALHAQQLHLNSLPIIKTVSALAKKIPVPQLDNFNKSGVKFFFSFLDRRLPPILSEFQKYLGAISDFSADLKEGLIIYESRTSFFHGLDPASHFTEIFQQTIFYGTRKTKADFYQTINAPINEAVIRNLATSYDLKLPSETIQKYLDLVIHAISKTKPEIYPEPKEFSVKFFVSASKAMKEYLSTLEEMHTQKMRDTDELKFDISKYQKHLLDEFTHSFKPTKNDSPTTTFQSILCSLSTCFEDKYKTFLNEATHIDRFLEWRSSIYKSSAHYMNNPFVNNLGKVRIAHTSQTLAAAIAMIECHSTFDFLIRQIKFAAPDLFKIEEVKSSSRSKKNKKKHRK